MSHCQRHPPRPTLRGGWKMRRTLFFASWAQRCYSQSCPQRLWQAPIPMPPQSAAPRPALHSRPRASVLPPIERAPQAKRPVGDRCPPGTHFSVINPPPAPRLRIKSLKRHLKRFKNAHLFVEKVFVRTFFSKNCICLIVYVFIVFD